MKSKDILITIVLIVTANLVSAYTNGIPADAYREVIADAPWRIEPNVNNIPILIFISDAQAETLVGDDMFSTFYQLRNVEISYNGKLIKNVTFNKNISNEGYGLIYNDAWSTILNVPISGNYLDGGEYNFRNKTVGLHIRINGDVIPVELPWSRIDDNREYDLTITVGGKELPKFDNWYCGDTHYHTIYTDNPTPGITIFLDSWGELGAPIDTVVESGKAIGLDWVTATDHGWEMTDEKWSSPLGLKNVCGNYGSGNFVCIPSEEFACLWLPPLRTDTSHYLVYNPNNYVKEYQHSCADIVQNLNANGYVGYVAHPEATDISFGIILRKWKDYSLPFNGLEVWNIESETGNLEEGLKEYDRALMNNLSRRIFISGGSDAQGNWKVSKSMIGH